jgi:AcrR family transcriptional regulator
MQRKSAILLSANSHFAHHGFRGASLRDIARDAGVSLTLLNHHFGSKFQLLSAVIDAHHQVLEDRMSLMRALMASPTGYTVRELVAALVRLGFEVAALPDGEIFLRLVARVIDDPEEEAVQVVREKIDDGAHLFVDALLGCYPQASRYTAACAYMWFNAALLKFLIGSRRLLRLARMESLAVSPAKVQLAPPLVPQLEVTSADGVRAFDRVAETAAVLTEEPLPAWPNPAGNLREDDQALLTRFLVAGIEAVMKT